LFKNSKILEGASFGAPGIDCDKKAESVTMLMRHIKGSLGTISTFGGKIQTMSVERHGNNVC